MAVVAAAKFADDDNDVAFPPAPDPELEPALEPRALVGEERVTCACEAEAADVSDVKPEAEGTESAVGRAGEVVGAAAGTGRCSLTLLPLLLHLPTWPPPVLELTWFVWFVEAEEKALEG